jgi:putative transposase
MLRESRGYSVGVLRITVAAVCDRRLLFLLGWIRPALAERRYKQVARLENLGGYGRRFGKQTAGAHRAPLQPVREVLRSLAAHFILPVMVESTRLRRLEWVFDREPIYFVTACTAQRRRILATEAIHTAFVTFATNGIGRGAVVGRYVIMPDHIHLFLALDPERITLSAWVKSFKNHVSKELRNGGEPAPHWQRGFFDHALRSRESYDEKWGYVLRNPVRARLVKQAEDWPFQGEINALEFRRPGPERH